jgi:Ca2+-binding RTX toxin-like protein
VFPDFSPAIRITGNVLNNSLYGGSGNDTLVGGLGNDWLEGLAGQDLFLGDAGSDALRGGDGIDTVSYRASGAAVIVRLDRSEGLGGDAQGDEIRGVENVIGSAFDDQIVGYMLANRFEGGAGDDTLDGMIGNDTLVGGAGADVLVGGTGRDTLSYAGSTAGGLQIDLDANTVSGGDGTGDAIAGFEAAIGGAGDDLLTGSTVGNELSGGAGSDTITGGAGNDTISGGASGDTLTGSSGNDTLSYAGSQQGVSVALDEPNPGDQHAVGGDATDDSLSGFENVIGGVGDDTLYGGLGGNRLAGGAGADLIDGNAGNDTVTGGAGADSMSGGDGIDTLSYAGAVAAVTVYLGAPGSSSGGATGDAFSGFENLEGGVGNDYLVGDAGNNRVYGGKGYDVLSGEAGDDTLGGGADGDAFVYASGHGNDTALDFTVADTLTFSLGVDYDSVEEVMAAAHAAGPAGEHTVFDFGAAGTLTILNMTLAEFPVDNIFF